jgi:hypothetical protein
VTAARISYRWHLRRLMADRDMYATTDLRPLLAERGIALSREQVYRLVTRPRSGGHAGRDVDDALADGGSGGPDDAFGGGPQVEAVGAIGSPLMNLPSTCGWPGVVPALWNQCKRGVKHRCCQRILGRSR